MIIVSAKHRVFLSIKPIDFRNGIDGIARICRNKFMQDPMSGHYFIFKNRRKTDIKILYYDSQGFCLFQKRLSAGHYQYWPKSNSDLITLTPDQLHVLIFNGNPNGTQDIQPWKIIANGAHPVSA